MKMAFIVLVSGTISLFAEEAKLTTAVSERKKNGQVIRRIETVRRGERVVMTTIKYLAPEDKKRTLRFYRVDGEVTMAETDDNGDGHFETFVLYRAEGMEIFERDENNEVTPASSDKVAKHKQQAAAFEEFFETALDQKKSSESVVEEIEKGRGKVPQRGSVE